jgi:hypothetical protein
LKVFIGRVLRNERTTTNSRDFDRQENETLDDNLPASLRLSSLSTRQSAKELLAVVPTLQGDHDQVGTQRIVCIWDCLIIFSELEPKEP